MRLAIVMTATLALTQFDEARETHHLAVVSNDLGDGAHQDQVSKLQQVDGRLGVPVALANPASAGMMCPGQCRLAGTKGRGRGQDGGTPWEGIIGLLFSKEDRVFINVFVDVVGVSCEG